MAYAHSADLLAQAGRDRVGVVSLALTHLLSPRVTGRRAYANAVVIRVARRAAECRLWAKVELGGPAHRHTVPITVAKRKASALCAKFEFAEALM
jgi:hypothetical protein